MFKTQDQEILATSTAAAPSEQATLEPIHELPLPRDFLWGAATAAYQIEGGALQGGKGPSIWDEFSHRTPSLTSGDTGDIACDHYNRYLSDVDLLSSYGVDEYRFSIAWTRIIPLGGRHDPVNEAGIAFYNSLVDALVARNIRPVATLYHWDLPLELERRYGGLLNTDEFRLDFERYARLCFDRFGDRVQTWITFNEPYISAVYGYILGVNAPGHPSVAINTTAGSEPQAPEYETRTRHTELAFRAAHSQIVAHAAAVRVYVRDFQQRESGENLRDGKKGQISIVLNGDFYEPWDADDPEDMAAAQRRMEFYMAWFADPIYLGTDYPTSMREFFDEGGAAGNTEGISPNPRLPRFTSDEMVLLRETAPSNGFYGMNHYTSQYARARRHGDDDDGGKQQKHGRDYTGNVDELPTNNKGREIGPISGASWLRVTPVQFRKLMGWVWQRYRRPIRVTENGCPCPGESELKSVEDAVQDDFRVGYFGLYLDAVSRAIYEDGVKVEGYFAWSLLDNFAPRQTMGELIDIEWALKELTQDEKIRLLSGDSTWATFPVERLGVPSITMSDGPHGVRGTAFFNGPPGMLLPCATAMAATFDSGLMEEAGEMLALEAQEKGCQVVLGPTVCLPRSPLLGRAFESFGEDPWLSGTMASAQIRGMQQNGVAASIKHLVAHDQSTDSPADSIRMSERTLREMHLMPFQIAAREADPWTVMTAYHRVNGVHSCEDRWLLDDVMRREWGWKGAVISDWCATYGTTEAVNAGMDLEMPGPTRWRGELLKWALTSKKVSPHTLDERVENVLRLLNKVSGKTKKNLDHRQLVDDMHHPVSPREGNREPKAGDMPEKRSLCRRMAAHAAVLLKNDRKVLPLDPLDKKRTYALIGPGVSSPCFSGGGSADLIPYYLSRPLEAMRELLGDQVSIATAIGCHGHIFTPLITKDIYVPGGFGCATKRPGLVVTWYGEDPRYTSPTPLHTTYSTQTQIYLADSLPPSVPPCYWLVAEMDYIAPTTTTMCVGLCVIGRGFLRVFQGNSGDEELRERGGQRQKKEDETRRGKMIAEIDLFSPDSHPPKTHPTPMFGQASSEKTARFRVLAGHMYRIQVVLQNSDGLSAAAGAMVAGGLRLGMCEDMSSEEDREAALQSAVTLARTVDTPIVMVGTGPDVESEAIDRTDLYMPGSSKTYSQDRLVQCVVEANPNTVVVLQSGTPVAMEWLVPLRSSSSSSSSSPPIPGGGPIGGGTPSAATVVQAWLGGMEAGHALMDVLFGQVNPCGRMPVTFPARMEDTPSFLTFGKADSEIYYGEGVFVGYRYYEMLKLQPLVPFGFGLSYTTFRYGGLRVENISNTGSVGKEKAQAQGESGGGTGRDEPRFAVEVDVHNSGHRAGHEIIQVYVADDECSVQRPRKELKGFTKVWIEPGATTIGRVELNKYAFSFWDDGRKRWMAEKGTFHVIIARSADPSDELLRATIQLGDSYSWIGL